MRDFRSAWTKEADWNSLCERRGYTAAVQPVPSWRVRLKRGLRFVWNGWRERTACRFAPWIIDTDVYDRIVSGD